MRRSLVILLPLLACTDLACGTKGGGVTPTDSGDTGIGDGGGGDGGGGDGGGGEGGGDGGSVTPGELDWTAGPALPDCSPSTASGSLVALSGVVLGPDGPVAGSVVYDRGTGLISCVGESCDTAGATVVCTEGVISAGLIDTHDHMQYNVTPPWQHDQLFTDRYDWRSSNDYWDYRTAFDEISNTYKCEIMRWAELRELVGGATSGVGSSGGSCIDGLIRNLDETSAASDLSNYDLYYSSSTVTDVYSDGDGDYYAGRIASGDISADLNHVAEGVDGAGTSEISWMLKTGMSGPGFAYVHATDATTQQLAELAVDGTAIIWSPRSNLDLYAQTTPADIAMRLGVPVALGPDWTWSGSLNPAHEAQCAVQYLGARGNPLTDVQLHGMITSEAARILGLDGVLGSLQAGLKADLAVFTWSDQPYRSVLESQAEDTRLVVVGGDALYGVTDLLGPARGDTTDCETIDACTATRTVCAVSGSSGAEGMTAAELASTLTAALATTTMPAGLEYAGELHGLWDCDDSYASCAPGETSGADADGDGVADSTDLCPGWFDPRQDDADGDGVGDACDPCPLAPDITDCPVDTTDIDSDGIANESDDCAFLYDPGQADRDADGKGDACDPCPDAPNPGDEACGSSIEAVRNPDSPDHVAEGTAVTLSGLVATSVRTNGFTAQDPSLSAWGGIFVYTGSAPSTVAGDVVTVTGTVSEYYGLTELTSPTIEITGSAAVPAHIELASACDVATGSSAGEELESMLVAMGSVTVTDSNPDSPSDFGEFQVDDCLRIDDSIYDFGTQPAEDTVYSRIQGVLTFAYDNTKVQPLQASDMVLAP